MIRQSYIKSYSQKLDHLLYFEHPISTNLKNLAPSESLIMENPHQATNPNFLNIGLDV